MPKALFMGHLGGYLNGAEITRDLDHIFVTGSVPDPKKQIQQAGIDLTLAKVYRGPFLKSFDSGGWITLEPGSYWLEFNEVPFETEESYELHLWPRSTLFRVGGQLAIGIGKLAGQADGRIGASLAVINPYGLRIQRGARVCQALVWAKKTPFTRPHVVTGHSRALTVAEILEYTSVGVLGVEERGVETAIVESGSVTLGGEFGYAVKFLEQVSVAPNEVIVSLADKPALIAPEYLGSTRPIFDPRLKHFLWIMGAIADPGYQGTLSGSIRSPLPHLVSVGDPLLSLKRWSITSVDDNDLYDGKYQNSTVNGSEGACAVWNSAGWYQPI